MSKKMNLQGVLVLLTGAYMLLGGISLLTGNTQGLAGFSHDISRAFGGSGSTVNIILAVVEIVAGALLIMSRFIALGSLDSVLRVAVFIFWIVLMVFELILNNHISAINTLGWWTLLVNRSIILIILWMIKD